MGFYISILENGKRCIKENKYGLGYWTLMFSEYKRVGNRVIFTANGSDALENLQTVADHLAGMKNNENRQRVEYIEGEIQSAMRSIKPDKVYTADYSEPFQGLIENPMYDPMSIVKEMHDSVQDAIYGFSDIGQRDDAERACEMLCITLRNLSDRIRVADFWRTEDKTVAYTAVYRFSDDDMDVINKARVSKENGEYERRYAKRELFYILKNAGMKDFQILSNGDNEYGFYIIFSRDYVNEWAASKPYVECSYVVCGSYPIRYLVRNTPKEKEKFYCHTSWHSAESIIIDGVEFCGLSDEEVSQRLGKSLRRIAYEKDEIDMKYIG